MSLWPNVAYKCVLEPGAYDLDAAYAHRVTLEAHTVTCAVTYTQERLVKFRKLVLLSFLFFR